MPNFDKKEYAKNNKDLEKPIKKVGLMFCTNCHRTFVPQGLVKIQYCPFCQTVNYNW